MDAQEYIKKIRADKIATLTSFPATEKFPLKSILKLYLKLPRWYFESNNFRQLAYWLEPYSYPTESLINVPRICNTYEIQHLAKLFEVKKEVIYTLCMEIHLENNHES